MTTPSSSGPGFETCLRQQSALADLGDRALATADFDALLADAADAVAECLPVERCVLVERLPDGRAGRLRAAAGTATDRADGDTVSLSSDTVLGEALTASDPIVRAVGGDDPAATEPWTGTSSDGGSVLAVRVGPADDPWGVVAGHAAASDAFAEGDATFLANAANVLALAIENERTKSDVEEIYGRISDAFFALDDEWRFTYLNDRARKLIGADDRSLVGENVWEAFPAAVERTFKRESERAMAEQETVAFEEYYPEPLDAWFEVRAYPSESGLSVYFRDVTDRKEAQQRLAEERDVFAQGPAIVFRWRNEEGWPVEYVSENVEDAFGYAPAELESGEVPYTDLLLEEDIDRIAEEVAANSDAETDRFSHDPYRIETRDGDVRWVTDTTKILRDDDGEITHYLGYLVDITERKEREEELRRYEAMIEAVEDGVYVVDENGEFTMVNEAYAEMTGYDREELVGEHVETVVDEEALARAQQTEAAMREGDLEGVKLEAELETKDGDSVPAEATFAMLPTRNGEAERRIGVVRDISERRERERKLAERERQLSTVIDNVPGMVYRHRNERGWPMEFVSDGCRDVTGYDPDALERGEVSFGADVVHEEDRARLWEAVQEGLDEDGSFHVSYRIVTAEGNLRWVRERGRRVETEDGTELIEGVIIDVTERKRLETELEEVFGRVTEAFYALDEEWRFTHVNERAEELLGRSEEALIGENLWETFPEAAETDHVRETFERAMETQEPQRYEAYSEARDFWVDATVYPSETGVSVYFEDATDVIERERDLERTERRFEAIFEDPNILVGLLDPDGTVLDINETAMEYIDADLEDVTGEPFWETPWWGEGDDVRDDVMEWTERAANGEYVDFEADLTRPDGERYVINGVFRPVTNDDGEVVSVIVSDRDVTERREYERQLAESERRYRTIAEYFPNGIVTLFDHDLEYTLAAGQGLGKVPVDAADVEGNHFSTVWGDEAAEKLEPVFQAALDGEERTVELEYEGREWVVHGVPITDDRGDVFAGMTMARDITERKERERELAKYETIVETINDGIYVKDADGYFTMVNEAYAEMTGYDREELVGEHASLVVDEETLHEAQQRRAKGPTGDEEGNPTMEAEIHRADGETVPTEGTFARIETGDEPESIGVVRDISERIEQRRRIEESERRYRTLVENFPNGAVGLFDENLEYTAVGGDLMEQAGVPKEERIGNRVSEIYPEEMVADIEPHFEAALEGEKNSLEIEFHDRHLHAHTLPVRNGDGDVFAGMLVVQDVTEQREAERELRESEARFRMLAENLDEIVWMASPDLEEIIYVNPAFEDVWGIDREVLYEESLAFLDAVHPEDRERVEAEFTSIPEEPFDEEFRIVRPDGERRWVHATGAQVHNEDAAMVRIVGTGQDVTERVRRERQLEESERRYRTLAEHFPNGAVGVYDEDLRYTLAEGAMLGDTLPQAEALEGERMPDTFPPATATDLEPLFRAAVEAGETGNVLTEFGGRNWQVWATPLRDADGEIFAGLSFAQDITEQVERERELERALDLLEKTERIADVGGWEIDVQSEDVFWTDYIFELLEVDADEEPPLEEALDMYHEDDRAFLQERIDRAIATREPFDVEVRLRTAATGEQRWLRLQGAPEVEDGEVVTVRGAAQDITERKRRERQLARRAEQQQAVADIGQFALESEDLDAVMHEASRKVADVLDNEYCEVLDLDDSDDELLLRQGVGWSEGIVGEASVSAVEADSQAAYTLAHEDPTVVEDLETEERFSGPRLLSDHDVRSGISTVIGPFDEPWGILGTHDVDRREYSEEDVVFVQSVANVLAEAIERKRYEEDLERLVAELEASNERLEQFAYAASHDLQEPLRMVSSYLRLIDQRYREALDEEGEEFLEFAVDGADRMREMIDGLLQYSRVDARGDPFEPVDLDDVLADVREDLQVKIQETDATIDAESLPTVEGDAGQLRQVLQNLLENAIEYSGDEPPRIELTATRSGDVWEISVHDEGIGIDPDDADKIFEVFESLHGPEEAGTGIGLALCERIVERHGGEIWVEAESGGGSTFTFTLPADGERGE